MPTTRYLVIFNWSKMRLPWKPFEQIHFCKELPPAHIDLGCQVEPGMFSFFWSHPPSKLSTIQNIKMRSRNILKILDKDIKGLLPQWPQSTFGPSESASRRATADCFYKSALDIIFALSLLQKNFVSWGCCLGQLDHKVSKSDLIPNWLQDALPRSFF